MSAPTVTTVTPAGFASIEASVRALDMEVHARTGHEALGDAVWRDFVDPGPDSAGVRAGDDVYAHVARSDNFSPQHWAVGLAIRPGAPDDVVVETLDGAAQHVATRGGGRMVVWVFAPEPSDDVRLARAGFEPARDLYEMRVSLPLAEEPKWPGGITVRDFEPGTDNAAWLQVNNRAFENHPEQGAWIEATLARRLAEDWFDASLFVLAFDDNDNDNNGNDDDADLAGFNWCKQHPAAGNAPPLGEIFVIGVDPHAAGRGLGRSLAIEGLARLHARGSETGSLFTDADNTRAISLYESLGFAVHRVDRSYARDVAAR